MNITAGQTSWTLATRECNDAGEQYQFIARGNAIPGYESVTSGKNITNNLILPNFTANLDSAPLNSFENKYLKNGKVKIEGDIRQNQTDRNKVGIHSGVVTVKIDSNIKIDEATIRIMSGGTAQHYTISNNIITIPISKTELNYKITVYLEGTLKQIRTYHNEIKCEGKLRSYTEENTNINLGQVATKTKDFTSEHQIPEANIQITKRDSITKEKLTDAEFTLYEWDGSKYKAVEEITDSNKDGIYTSKYYSWNHITQGKYKLVETGLPQYHRDLGFYMEYTINQIKTDKYTITADYDNNDYKIEYKTRKPDEYVKEKGIIENEPWKVKVEIENVDKETQNKIKSQAEYTIYEWNKEKEKYEESDVKLPKQENLNYLSSNWLYYTKKNEGKYYIEQTKAAHGYYGDYDENKQKKKYYINLVEWIQGTEGENEGTIKIKNAEKFENIRTKSSIGLQIIDSQTKGEAQSNATIEDAIYGLYASEVICHSDGTTKRYDEEGVLYQKDELIQAKRIDAEGKALWEDLECGRYYIKMIKAPEGYKFDETKYEISTEYKDESQFHIHADQVIEIQVKKQAFKFQKVAEDGAPLTNAGFTIYQLSELTIVKEGKIKKVAEGRYSLEDEKAKEDKNLTQKANEDGTYTITDLINYYYKIEKDEQNREEIPGNDEIYNPYNLEKEKKVKNYEKNPEGEDIEELKTDEKGYIISPKLAYGEYIVIETSVPRNQDLVQPFVIKIQDDSEEPKDLCGIVDPNFRSKLKLYVKDKETNEDIVDNHSEYVIRDVRTKELQTYTVEEDGNAIEYGTIENPFIVGESGNLIIPIKLEVGDYEIEQLKAPIGYAKNYNSKMEQENVRISIMSNTAYYVDKETGEYVTVVNQTNEQTKVKITTIDKETKKQISGIKLEIRNEEGATILNNTEEENKKGEMTIQKIPVGKYRVVETEIPYERGYVVKQENELIVQDTSEEQKLEIKQELSHVKITVQDEKTKEKLKNAEVEIRKKDSKEIVATMQKENKKEEKSEGEQTGSTEEKTEGYQTGNTEEKTEGDQIENTEGKTEEDQIENTEEKTEGDQAENTQDKPEESKEDTSEGSTEDKKEENQTENTEEKTEENQAENIEEQEEIEKQKEIRQIDDCYVVEGLPVGEYEIIEKVPDGYKQIEEREFTVNDTAECQDEIIENRKLIFSMQVEKKIEVIQTSKKKVNVSKIELPKIEVRSKNIKTENVEVQYAIEIKNTGEIEGTIGIIKDIMPKGLEYVKKDNNWKIEKGVAICDKYKDKKLKPGESKKINITLKWKNGTTNFGEKVNKVSVEGSGNQYNYSSVEVEEDEAPIIVGIRTGKEDIPIIVLLVLIISAVIILIIRKIFKIVV